VAGIAHPGKLGSGYRVYRARQTSGGVSSALNGGSKRTNLNGESLQ